MQALQDVVDFLPGTLPDQQLYFIHFWHCFFLVIGFFKLQDQVLVGDDLLGWWGLVEGFDFNQRDCFADVIDSLHAGFGLRILKQPLEMIFDLIIGIRGEDFHIFPRDIVQEGVDDFSQHFPFGLVHDEADEKFPVPVVYLLGDNEEQRFADFLSDVPCVLVQQLGLVEDSDAQRNHLVVVDLQHSLVSLAVNLFDELQQSFLLPLEKRVAGDSDDGTYDSCDKGVDQLGVGVLY